MPLGKRTSEYSYPVVMPDGETIRVVLRGEDGELIYPEPGGQAIGVLSMIGLLEGILEQLQIMNIHLAAVTGESIASVED